MKTEADLEQTIRKNELAIAELSIQIETLNNQVDTLLSELNVSHEQLKTFIENKENFTEENWTVIVEQRKALDEKLMRELMNVRNPLKAKKAFAERNVQPHWLFVR